MIINNHSDPSDCNNNSNTLQIAIKAEKGDTTTQHNTYSIERRRVIAKATCGLKIEN